MWIKLTGATGPFLLQSDEVGAFYPKTNGYVSIKMKNGCEADCSESLAEIELMLKGAEPQKSDPRSRDVIGNKHKDYWDNEGR